MRMKHWFYTVPLRFRSLFRSQQVENELDEDSREVSAPGPVPKFPSRAGGRGDTYVRQWFHHIRGRELAECGSGRRRKVQLQIWYQQLDRHRSCNRLSGSPKSISASFPGQFGPTNLKPLFPIQPA